MIETHDFDTTAEGYTLDWISHDERIAICRDHPESEKIIICYTGSGEVNWAHTRHGDDTTEKTDRDLRLDTRTLLDKMAAFIEDIRDYTDNDADRCVAGKLLAQYEQEKI